MRRRHLATSLILAWAVASGACGADRDGAGLVQLGADGGPTITGPADVDTAIAPDTTTPPDDTTAPPPDTTAPPADTTAPPADTTPADTTPADTTPADTTPADTGPEDTSPPQCVLDPDCDVDTALAACERVACVAGACVVVKEGDGATCDDGDACTQGDACKAGACVGAPVVCTPSAPCRSAVCVAGGCVESPTSGGPCNDGDACTTGDTCDAGVCVGTPFVCDDGDVCTADSCLGGVCKHEPIPGCGVVAPCVGKEAGASCDDGDPTTAGDLCLLGVCRGFKLTRINASSALSSAQGLVITEVDRVGSSWWSIFWTVSSGSDFTFTLADVTNPAAPATATATSQHAAFFGLVGGFATDVDGRIWHRTNAGWSRSNPWDQAVGASGRGIGYDLWVEANLAGTPTRLWVVGEDDVDDVAWIRACGLANSGSVTCAAQTLDDLDPASIPLTVSGVEGDCTGTDPSSTCGGSLLVIGADAPATDGAVYKDSYENLGGALPVWTQGHIPQGASVQYTRASAGWGAGEFLVVGTEGFMRHRRTNGSWSGSLVDMKTGMSQRDFTGIWVGAGVIAVSAWRLASGTIHLELWTCAIGKDPEQGASWIVHDLGSADYASAAGLYDVHGSDHGELVAVGAVRRVGSSQRLDGVVLVRGGLLP